MEAPRPAATVVVARDAPGGPEVLVLRRGPAQRFLPGYVAFPGGAIDPEDAAAAARWFAADAEAARACAIRELAEEVGLAFTGSGLREGTGSLDAIEADPPPVTALVEISRWIAPPTEVARFDARFFAVDAGPESAFAAPAPRPDGVEASSAWWAAPTTLLRDEPAIHHPTRAVLAALAPCRDVAAILALRVEQEEPIARAGGDRR